MSSFFRRLHTAYRETNCPSFCWMVPISLVVLAINLRAYNSLDVEVIRSGGALNYVVKSLDTAPISTLTTTSGTCAEGFHSLTIGTWPGVKSDDGTDSNPVPLKNWGATQFCVKRLENYEFTLGECKEGFKRCHTDLCVSNEESCPVTNLKFWRPTPSTPDSADGKASKDVVSFRGSDYTILRNYADYPIINLEVSYYNYPCLSSNVRPKKPSPTFAKLNAIYGCNPYGSDSLSTLLDSETESQLYADNDLEAQLANIGGYYDTVIGEIVYLTLRPRVELKPEAACYLSAYSGGGFGPGELIGFIQSTKLSLYGLMGVEALTVAFCVFAIFLFGCGNTETKENVHNFNRPFFMFSLLTEIVFIAMAWYTVGVDSVYLQQTEESLEKVSVGDCFYNKNIPAAWNDYKTQVGEGSAGEFAIFMILALSLSAGGFLIKSIGCLWIFFKRR